MIPILAQTLVTPATVDTAPQLITAFVSGMLAPVGLWSILFVATLVRKGHRVGGGIIES